MAEGRDTDEIEQVESRPVYVDSCSPNWFADADEAAQAVWDDGRDPTTVEAFYCTVAKAPVPNLIEVIEEMWWEQYDDPDLSPGVSKRLATLLGEAQALAEAEAPDVWTQTKERVSLPPVDCPDCGTPSNEPWDDLRPDCKFCDRPTDADKAAFSGSSGGAS